MKRWLWGLVSGVLLTPLLFFVLGIVVWWYHERPPQVEANTSLILDLQGGIPEQSPPDLAEQILGFAETPTFLSLIQSIENATQDKRITAILLKPSNLELGWAKLEQLRGSLQAFKRSGKKVLALIGEGGSREYFLASVADQVFLSPVGALDLKGMRVEVMFFKDTLTKLGVKADLEHIGKYKNFSDQFTDDRMSDAFREAESAMLDSIYGNFVHTIAVARHRSADDMRVLIEENGPFSADQALSSKLVDGLGYEDQVLEELKGEKNNSDSHKLSINEYSKVPATNAGGERVAVVYAVGAIASGTDQFNPLEGGKTMGSKSMEAVLDEVGKDDSVKGVIVRIDSPGGDAFASDDIWRGMVNLRGKKPIVISMSDTAASGGYYMAMTGDPIVAEPGTVTGSIGIVYGKMNLKGLYDKVGITKELLMRGKFSAMDSDYASYSPEERERVRSLMADFYTKFVGKVASARKMSPEAVDKIAQGRVWTGEQAKKLGLVDELGGFSKALELLKAKAGMRPDARVEFVEFPARKTLLESVFSRSQAREMQLPAGVSRLLSRWEAIQPISRSFLQARMPYAMEFR